MNLISLQFKTTSNFQNNLDTLVSYINKAPKGAFIVAPELCLTGYSYDILDQSAQFSQKAIQILGDLSKDKTICLTLISKGKNDKYLNTLYFFSNNNIIHTQSKYHLFKLNDEEKYFLQGDKNDIKIVEYDGLKISFLICFELRFIDFWQDLRGSDIIIIPAMWGKARKEQLEILSKALAIANQCFVVVSNSANDDMAKSSAIITPFGKTYIDDDKEFLMQKINLKEIKKMRRYLPVGIN